MTELAVRERTQTSQARRGLAIYFLLVGIGSAFFE
jgi:hypothetical protein